jgi:hypothetical protein
MQQWQRPHRPSYWRLDAIKSTTTSSTTDSSSSSSNNDSKTLNDSQLDFTLGYLNKHHTDVLVAFVECFSELGVVKSKKNAWSGGSYKIESARIVDINTEMMKLDVSVQERGKDAREETVQIELGTSIRIQFDNLKYSSPLLIQLMS